MRFKQFLLEAEKIKKSTETRTYKVWAVSDKVSWKIDEWLRSEVVEVDMPQESSDQQWHNRAVRRYLTSQADRHQVSQAARAAFYARNTAACKSKRVEHTPTPLDILMTKSSHKQHPGK